MPTKGRSTRFGLSAAERITLISIVVTTTVGAIEFMTGSIFGSIAVVAAGIDALADTATSMAVIAGLRVSKRPPDSGHPYGHRQAETLASIFLSAALVFAGIRIASLAMDRFYQGGVMEATTALFVVALGAVIVSSVLAKYKISIGKRTGNPSVVADGYHTSTDAVSAAVVLLGIGLVAVGYPQADPVIALAVSILVVRWGLGIGRDAVNTVMEVSPGPAVMADIKKVAMSVPGVHDCHRCRARKVGSRIFADLHVLVGPRIHVDVAHAIATKVESRLKEKIPNMGSVVVHVEPQNIESRGKVRKKRK